jgi:hypothetical protein
MLKRKLLFLALILLMISAGIAVAQSSGGFSLLRTTLSSGGRAESGSYAVQSAIGQPATGVSDSARFRVVAGFLVPRAPAQGEVFDILLPAILR